MDEHSRLLPGGRGGAKAMAGGGLGLAEGVSDEGMGRVFRPGAGHVRTIGVVPLTALVFFTVSGGPLGSELAVQAGGAGLALLGFAVMPLVWSVPEAGMTAELCSAYPEAAGFSAWVNAAYGPFWSFIDSWFSWLSGVIDNAVYPVLLLAYMSGKFTGDDDASDALGWPWWGEWLFTLGFVGLLTYATWRGLDIAGWTAMVLTIAVLSPFAVFCAYGIASGEVSVANWTLPPSSGRVDWKTLLNVLFWNLSSFSSAASWSAEVVEPASTIPWAMKMSVLVLLVTYLGPLAVATGARPDAEYCSGCYPAIADDLTSGNLLGTWMVVGAAGACVALFIAEMSSDAYQIMGMSHRGQLPKIVGLRSVHGTPTIGIALSALGVAVLQPLSFAEIIELENMLFIFAELIEFTSFVELRKQISERGLTHPYSLPLHGTMAVTLFFAPAALLLFAVLALSSWKTWCLSLLTAVLGVAVYVGCHVARKRHWTEFEAVPPEWAIKRDPPALLQLLALFGVRPDYSHYSLHGQEQLTHKEAGHRRHFTVPPNCDVGWEVATGSGGDSRDEPEDGRSVAC